MNFQNEPLLEEGLIRLGLFDDRFISLLTRYIEEIELFNAAYGLVKVKDRRELIVKHILDSLAPLSILQSKTSESNTSSAISGINDGKRNQIPLPLFGAPSQSLSGKKIADVGSGAGLPGIPLAICLPDTEFTLIERMGRRAGFLRDVLAVLGLSNVKVEEAQMEKLSISKTGLFDIIVFRAFKPLNSAILNGLLRLLAPDGIIAAYKGRRQSIEEEMNQLFEAANKSTKRKSITALSREQVPMEQVPWEQVPLEVPFLEEERHLLLIKKNVQYVQLGSLGVLT